MEQTTKTKRQLGKGILSGFPSLADDTSLHRLFRNCPRGLFLMRLIPLTQGKFAIVDVEDYKKLSKYKWFLSGGYAARQHRFTELPLETKTVRVNMARILLELYSDDKLEPDHKNHSKLDNRKANLRPCTRSQNQGNKRSCKGTSKYKGVQQAKDYKKWLAKIGCNGKQYHLGTFDTEVEAATAYDAKAIELFGEFARTNF